MARPNIENYAKMFQNCTAMGKAIKKIQVRDMDKTNAAMEVVITLWDETLVTSSLPGWVCANENKAFIDYYVNEVLVPVVTGHDPTNQGAIDKILDQLIANISCEELEKVARNVNWAVSVAVCKAGSHCKETSTYKYIAELFVDRYRYAQLDTKFKTDFQAPVPYLNIANGELIGEISRRADQHLLISHSTHPKSFNGTTRKIQRVYDEYLKVRSDEIDHVESAIGDGDDGSYTPNINDIKNCLRLLQKTLTKLGLDEKDKVAEKVLIGVNMGASKFYNHDKKTYCLNFGEEGSDKLVEMGVEALDKAYMSLFDEFKSFAVFEDIFHMHDKEYSSKFTWRFGNTLVITELDYSSYNGMYTENHKSICNCLHLKVGQIGSVSKCFDFVVNAKRKEWSVVMSSHDSCETSEPFLADFCIGLSLDRIKIGVSCFTSACNVCNRVRELEVERAEERWSWCPVSLAKMGDPAALAFIGNGDVETKKKECFKARELHGF